MDISLKAENLSFMHPYFTNLYGFFLEHKKYSLFTCFCPYIENQ